VDDQSILLQLLGVPPSTPSPTPEQMDAHEQFARGYQATGWRRPARKTLESVQDLLLGALGFPTDTSLSKGAELFSAAIPVVGGAKSALTGAKALTRIKNPIKAWHGTPHDYAAERLIRRADGSMEYLVGKPDVLPDVPPGATVIEDYPLGRQRLDKIGTGEGAQAKGHGLYAAEAADTGRSYRDSVGMSRGGGMREYDAELKIGGRRIEDVYSSMERAASRLPIEQAQREYDKLQILEDLGHEGDVLAVQERAKLGLYSPESLAWFEKHVAPKFTRKGRLYEVNLHVDPDELLDWDAPLSQHKRAQAFAEDLKHGRVDPGDIGGFSRDDQRHVFRSMGPMTTGKRFYSLLGADPSTSDVLRHAGIPGVKYFEGEFRSVDPDVVRKNLAAARAQLARWGTPEATRHPNAANQREMFQKRIDGLEKTLAHAEANPRTRNYVIFDENRIEIVKKFGIALALGAGLISQAEAEQLKAQGYQ